MVVIERDADGTPTVWCDPEIADLVVALNKAGVRTVASCSGHEHRPGSIALADGRWLTIASDRETHRRIESMFPVDINGNPHTLSPAGKGGLQAIVADIRHSALVDDYEPQQIAFLESIADRLATEQPASSAPPGVMVGCYVVDEASCVPHFHPTYGSGLFVTAAAILAQPAPAAAVTWHRFEDRMPPSQEWVMAKSRLTGAVTPLSVLTDEAAADLIERYEGWHAIVAPAAEQDVPQGGDDGVVPLDLEQHEREALNYLGSALKDRNSKRAVDKALALCDFYAGRNQLTFCHRDLLQRKLLPAAAPAVAKMWLELVEQIAAPLNCRASEHVDANAHVIAAARCLAATQPEARGVEAAIREVREAEIFSDGVEADLHMAGIHGEAAAFMAGRLAALDELTDTLDAAPAAPRVQPSFTELQAWALANGHSGKTNDEAYAAWRSANAQHDRVQADELAQEWLKYARDLRGDGCYSCCAGTYEHCAAHLKALFGKCPHPGCKFTDGKPCAYAHCPQQGSIEGTSR